MKTVASAQSTARKIYDDEWDSAQKLTRDLDVPRFSEEQLSRIHKKTAELMKWRREHTKLHNFVGIAVLVGLFAIDAAILLCWPALDVKSQIFFGVLVGLLHGFLDYSITTFSLHEGAAHQAIIYPQGRFDRLLALFANNASRVFFSDPAFYSVNHVLHHQKFATREDGAFSNYVRGKRVLCSLLPFAMLFNLTDYKIHSGIAWSKSRVLSAFLGGLYALGYGVAAGMKTGWFFAILVIVVMGPCLGFTLDRLRETSEHSLLPLDKLHGSRNLGNSIWGMIIGGGPWGQPNHLSHHLGPGLVWYHQIALHRELMKIMTPNQRMFFVVEPGLFGFPKFFYGQISALLKQA